LPAQDFVASSARGDAQREIAMAKRAIKLPSKGLLEARVLLRNEQAKRPTRPGAVPASGRSTLSPALAWLEEYGKLTPTGVPGKVKRGPFTYDRKLEQRRIARAKALVQRSDPGPFEDPVYLAMLAYQAASLELAFPKRLGDKQVDHGWSRFLLGTIHSSELNAMAQAFIAHNYTVVLLYSALVEFIYQAAKAAVAATNPTWGPDNRAHVIATKEHVTAQLAKDAAPIERLYRTLEAYFFNGYPRAFANEQVPIVQQLPLSPLVGLAERWVIGHEFGHGFAVELDWQRAPNPDMAEEYFADEQATILAALSTARVDDMAPEFALAGGAFALACLEVFERALSVLRHGKVVQAAGDGIHPTNQARADHIVDTFERYFDADPEQGPAGLNFVLRPDGWKPTDSELSRSRREMVSRWPNVLYTIWDQVHPRLLQDFESKRPLHPMWKQAADS
jgi:hypothetical protein